MMEEKRRGLVQKVEWVLLEVLEEGILMLLRCPCVVVS